MAIVSGSCGSVNAANGPSFTATPGSGLGSHSQPMVVVWEWQDDQGHWRPYSGQVSAYIERCVCPPLTGAGLTNICLGHSDPRLAHYLIDIPGRKQFRQDTGKTRSVRRSLFAQSSGLGSGVFWEWANDEGTWTPYETRTSILLEHSYHARQGTADLASHGYNYIVDLTSLTQPPLGSPLESPLGPPQGPLDPPLGPLLDTPLPPLDCPLESLDFLQDPLLGFLHSPLESPLGPLPGSPLCPLVPLVWLQGPLGTLHPWLAPVSSVLQSSGRTTAAHPTSVYSPYPRRPLSVGSVSWGSPWLPPTAAGHPSLPHPHSSSSGMSVPSVSVHLNGSNSVSSALAACGQRPEEVIQRYMEVVVGVPDEDCIICMDQLSNPSTYEAAAKEERSPVIEAAAVGKFIKCGHTLHMLCMLAMYNNGTKDGSLQCPSCKTIYGEKTGTQPKGKMEIYSISQSLPGHPDCGTIQIIYSIPPGIQSPEHPNPGQPYSCRGFPRFCFLPDNGKGRKVLELLKVAWMRRLIFTVGTSSTTGEPDTVVWNGIHHKTEMMSNLSGHGYPDPNYLDNVLSELASQGITEDLLQAHS
uniref:E3 ubiquitin-protein ligase n=1 Tax=Knipowitschia caucasica TaxID=637954 RepID=A0AAV2JAA0_KNICA